MSYVGNLNIQDKKWSFKNVFIVAVVCNFLEGAIYQMHIITIDNYSILN
jgi:hypothetical protein